MSSYSYVSYSYVSYSYVSYSYVSYSYVFGVKMIIDNVKQVNYSGLQKSDKTWKTKLTSRYVRCAKRYMSIRVFFRVFTHSV